MARSIFFVSTWGLPRQWLAVAKCLQNEVFFSCPPEGGLGSSWLKHASKQRSPTTLIGVVRVVVVLVLERVFVAGGEVFRPIDAAQWSLCTFFGDTSYGQSYPPMALFMYVFC
jgi:hypothetical protein